METNQLRSRIAILGGGPIGIEAAIYARALGYPTILLDRGPGVCSHVRRWGHVRLFTPWSMNTSPLGRSVMAQQDLGHPPTAENLYPTGQEWTDQYWAPLSHARMLRDVLRWNLRVTSVGKQKLRKTEQIAQPSRASEPFRILCESGDKETEFSADIVIDATGTFGNSNWMGGGSMPSLGERQMRQQMPDAVKDTPESSFLESGITFELPDFSRISEHLSGSKILVIGNGYSAATNVVSLAKIRPIPAIDWLTRATVNNNASPIPLIESDPLPARVQLTEKSRRLCQEGQVNWFPGQFLKRIRRGSTRRWIVATTGPDGNPDQGCETEYDWIIANVGFRPDTSVFQPLQVHLCYATEGPIRLAATLLSQSTNDCLQIEDTQEDRLRTSEANFFVIGSKSYGRNSRFLFANGLKQINQVFKLISGDRDLDLYQDPQSSVMAAGLL